MPPPDSPTDFLSPYYNADEHPESPKPPGPEWRGVMIAAPAQIVLSLRNPLLILRGCYCIQGSEYPADDQIKITALDEQAKRKYTGVAGQRDASPEVPRPAKAPPKPETLKRMVFSGFFNADLLGTLGLPPATATYRVRVEFGNIPSNEITIQVALR